MNISPILLLVIGSLFALLYGSIITFGWAKTRKNRRIYQKAMGVDEIPVLDLSNGEIDRNKSKKTISLIKNVFLNQDNQPINIKDYNPYIAKGSSKEFPQIKEGNLIFVSKADGKIKYAFECPDLSNYR